MDLPTELKYTKEHEWLKIDSEDETLATIGITDFAQGELGEIVYVEIETVGEELQREEVFGTVEAVKTTSDLFMPVSGTVEAFNDELNEQEGDNPGLINEDPYEQGWIVKIRLSNPDELEDLLSAESYGNLIE